LHRNIAIGDRFNLKLTARFLVVLTNSEIAKMPIEANFEFTPTDGFPLKYPTLYY